MKWVRRTERQGVNNSELPWALCGVAARPRAHHDARLPRAMGMAHTQTAAGHTWKGFPCPEAQVTTTDHCQSLLDKLASQEPHLLMPLEMTPRPPAQPAPALGFSWGSIAQAAASPGSPNRRIDQGRMLWGGWNSCLISRG